MAKAGRRGSKRGMGMRRRAPCLCQASKARGWLERTRRGPGGRECGPGPREDSVHGRSSSGVRQALRNMPGGVKQPSVPSMCTSGVGMLAFHLAVYNGWGFWVRWQK